MWATFDVLMCTASIWHMCTMSMDRYFTLKYPMKYGRNKTRTMVALKILFVWIISIAICCPVCILGFVDSTSVYNNGACVPTIRSFILYGSLFAFYVPLCIMVVTYVLTIKILCDNQKLMKSIAKQQGDRKGRRDREGSYSATYLSPNMYLPRFMERPSIDTTASGLTSYNETSVHDTASSPPKEEHLDLALSLEASPQPTWEQSAAVKGDGPPAAWETHNGNLLVPTPLTSFWDSIQNVNTDPDSTTPFNREPISSGNSTNNLGNQVNKGFIGNTNQGFLGNTNNGFVEHVENGFTLPTPTTYFSDIPAKNYFSMSTSQPHLPSALSRPTSPMVMRQRLTSAPLNSASPANLQCYPSNQHLLPSAHHRSTGRLSCQSKSSVNQEDGLLSGASSLNSMLSRNNWGSGTAFSEFDDPELMDKLSMIEQEMDDCLRESRENLPQKEKEDPKEEEGGGGEDEEDDEEVEEEGGENGDEEDEEDEDDNEELEADEKKASLEQLCQPEEPEFQSCEIVRPVSSIPPVLVSSPPVTSSDDTLDDTDSEKSDLITIHLKASGCYMYQIDPSQSGSLLPCLSTKGQSHGPQSPSQPHLTRLPDSTECSADELDHDQDRELFSQPETEDSASESISGHSRMMVRKFPPKKKKKQNSRIRNYATGWKTLMRRKKNKKNYPICKINGILPGNMISKRTASNEKKASKVLGIIFAVFVVLWTPFFMVNILSVACRPCNDALTPPMMAAIVWLGYLSSLANPIIYTMFNTAFRRAFYRILTCQLPKSRSVLMPDNIGMTNATNWGSDRRNTLTLTLKEY